MDGKVRAPSIIIIRHIVGSFGMGLELNDNDQIRATSGRHLQYNLFRTIILEVHN